MSINAEIQKTGNESAIAMIRKFSRRVQGTGLVKTVRGQRYYARNTSKTVQKKRALKLLKRRADYRKAVKEGKIAEVAPRFGQRPQQRENTSSTSKLGETTPIAR